MILKQVTDEGLNLKFLAPCDFNNIKVDVYKNKIVVEIHETEFTSERRYVQEFTGVLNPQEAKAKLENGILSVLIPYNEQEKPKQLKIY